MNKKIKIFVKIVYYVFTFGLGILLAVVLPGIIMTSDIPGHIEQYLKDGEYAKSINLIINYDDKEIAYQKSFEDGSGIVLFRTLVTMDEKDSESKLADKAYLSYSGFLYNTQNYYKTQKDINNRTRLVVNEGLPDENKITLLNYDTNEDDLYDEVLSKISCTYVYFEVLAIHQEEVKSLTFYDADGYVYQKTEMSLDYTHVFFTSLSDYLAAYNNENRTNEAIQAEEDKFLKLSESYEKCSYQDERKMAQKQGAIIVLIYFICIYLIADFLVGQHFIIRFFIWLSNKLRKKKDDEAAENAAIDSVYGKDYYTMVTMKFIVPEEFDGNITVQYHNENDQIEMIFSKDKDYTVTQRIHAGSYMNSWLEVPGYVSENLPKQLEVKGYSMKIEVSIRKDEQGN